MIIGLLEQGLPKLGVIFRPIDDLLYDGIRDEKGPRRFCAAPGDS